MVCERSVVVGGRGVVVMITVELLTKTTTSSSVLEVLYCGEEDFL